MVIYFTLAMQHIVVMLILYDANTMIVKFML